MTIKKHEKKGRSVVINEDIVHAADGNRNGDAKVDPMGQLKRRNCESPKRNTARSTDERTE